MTRFCRVVVLALLVAPLAHADEIFFRNGDRLTGEILSTDGGKVKFKSPVLGEVQFNLSDLESFKSEKPVDVRLKDGGRAKAPVSDAEKNQVVIAPGTPAARTVPTEQIRAVNPREGWTGSLAAGANFARGNTEVDQANINLDLERRTERDRTSGGAAYQFGRQKEPDSGEKKTTLDNWNARAKYDYFFNEKLYGYGNVKAEQDNIAHLDLRLTPGIGLGYQWNDSPAFSFSGEAGITYVYEKFNADFLPAGGGFRESKEFISGRLALKAQWRINDRLTLFQNSEWLPSLQDIESYLINADAGVRVDLTSRMFMEYKLTLQYNSMPAPGAGDTDLRHMVSIGWQF